MPKHMLTKAFQKIEKINQNFLLGSLSPDREILGDLFAQYKDVLDWAWLFSFSRKQKVYGIFIDRLERCGIANRLSTERQAQIKLIQSELKQRLEQVKLTFRQIYDVFKREQIPFLVFKGHIYAEELYEDPVIRPYHDIDLLVSPSYMKKAEEALYSLGYTFYCPPINTLNFIPLGHTPKDSQGVIFPEEITRALYQRYHYHFPFVVPKEDKRLHVDLHWDLFSPGSLKLDSESLWEQTREIVCTDLPVQTFTMEASLVYMATKIAQGGPESFIILPLCDIRHHLKYFDDQAKLRSLWQLVDQWGVEKHFTFSLKLTRKLLNVDISTILNHGRKSHIFSDAGFHVATNKDTLMKTYKSYRAKLFRMIPCSLFWDLRIWQFPRRIITQLVRAVIQFSQKKGLLKSVPG